MDILADIIKNEGLTGHPDAELLAKFIRGAYPIEEAEVIEKFITMLGVLFPRVETRRLLQEHCPESPSLRPAYQRAANSFLDYLRRMVGA